MKRILTLVAASALILGLAATASAEMELKAQGSWRVQGNVLSNFNDYSDDDADEFGDGFSMQQRMRNQWRFVYNENVMAELYTEIGDITWGDAPTGGDIGADGTSLIEVKRAFIQFRWPDTDVLVTTGIQDVTFPTSGAFSSMIMADDAAATAVSTPISDVLGLTVAYVRAQDNRAAVNDQIDAFLAAVPVALDGMTIAPYFAYAMLNNNAVAGQTDDANAWWAGATFNMDMLDPIIIYADFAYGTSSDDLGDASGWLIDAMVEYTALDFATIQAFAAYSSQNDDGDGAMPTIATGWGIGGSLAYGSAFTTDEGPVYPGFWLAGAALRKIQFIEKLSHDVIVYYAKGVADTAGFGVGGVDVATGRSNLPALTSDDSYLEVDFNHRYQIYESLAALVELAYGKPSFDDDTLPDDAVMKATFGFQYNF